ncbi:MAG: hypothetical protein H3C54_05455 [Taibaiella sp.]|nr:hypothetical protein [Taibaiella sp.]
MKYPVISFLLASTLFANSIFAQKLTLVKAASFAETDNTQKYFVCYDRDVLQPISDSMFKSGNPKYIWVDLLMDGYISEGDNRWHNLHLYLYESTVNDSMIPLAVQIAYVEKWKNFVASLNEPHYDYGYYHFDLHNGIDGQMIFNPESDFRKVNKAELKRLHLAYRGELRLYKELVKDGLASMDKALDLEFSSKGFYVHGKRLNYEQRIKYMALLEEEYGHNYYNDHSSMAHGALAENTLGMEIAELEEKINNAAQKTNQ